MRVLLSYENESCGQSSELSGKAIIINRIVYTNKEGDGYSSLSLRGYVR